MQNWIKQLSPLGEFFLVILLGFGYFIFDSFRSLDIVTDEPIVVTNTDALVTVVEIIAILVVIAWILKIRQWKLNDFSFAITWPLTGMGFLLAIVNIFITIILFTVAKSFIGESFLNQIEIQNEINPFLMIVLAFFIGLVEELLLVVYVFKVMEPKNNIIFVVGLSSFIRLSFHFHLGLIAFIAILPLSIIFCYVYWKTRQIWPIVSANAFTIIIKSL